MRDPDVFWVVLPSAAAEDGIHLRLVQVWQFTAVVSFERHRADLSGPLNVLWAALGNKPRYSVQRSEPLITCACGTPALGFQVIQKSLDHVYRKIIDGQKLDRLSLLASRKRQ